MIQRQAWVDHQFNLGIDPAWAQNVICRVQDTAIRIQQYVNLQTEKELSAKNNGNWSVKEHIGHLIDLEALWSNRFEQFSLKTDQLIHADMSNQKTEHAHHNEIPVIQLIDRFKKERSQLIEVFNSLSEDVLYHEALHPRLKVMMKPIDLLFFIAEHDDHHLSSIREILRK